MYFSMIPLNLHLSLKSRK